MAALARQVAIAPYGVGTERLLEELVQAEMPSGEEWLRALGEFGAARGHTAGSSNAPSVQPVAILVLVESTS